ncbi:latrophilin-like protein 1 [Cylas formicarius]|uniref:latrophilin-like protein 1 n=1 Tax=Cylas formicarius TaxID=197179 RepID=UPI0029586775|nr:latrophilin-like protein 1 [Cylas formicarius]
MCRLCLTFFTTALVLQSSRHSQQQCQTENTNATRWATRSNLRSQHEVVLSTPPCLDDSDKLLTRICLNHSWYPPDNWTCSRYLDRDSQCPSWMLPCSDDCCFVTPPKPWSECSLPVSGSSTTLNATTTWLPYKRSLSFGSFESTTFGSGYGRPINHVNIINPEDGLRKNCLVLDTVSNHIYPETCSSRHQISCLYQSDRLKDALCPNKCVFSLHSRTCFCKRGRTFCDNYAIITMPSEMVLIQSMVDRKPCYLGGVIGEYREVINNRAWFYSSDDFDCALCAESPRTHCPDVSMILKFNDKWRKLYLLLYSPQCVVGGGRPDMVYCFTDAGDELKKRVDVSVMEVVPSFDEGGILVYDVDLEDYVGNYWCTVHTLALDEFRMVRSNTVLAYKKDKGNEFSVRLAIESVCDHYDCTLGDDMAVPYDNFVAGFIDDPIYKVRVMEIFSYDDDVELLIHVSTPPGSSVTADYATLSHILHGVPAFIKIVYLRSSEWCLPERNKDLSWPRTRWDECTIPTEYCVQGDGWPVYRSCYGDFFYGAFWSAVFGECASTATTPTTDVLLAALNETICEGVLRNVSAVTRHGNLSLVDLYYVSQILDNVSSTSLKTNTILDGTLDVVDGLLNVEAATLANAQMSFNLTDEFLHAAENISIFLDDIVGVNVATFVKNNVLVHSFKPFSSQVCGFALYRNNSFAYIPFGQTFDALTDIDNVKLASYIPVQILEDLQKHNLTNASVTTTIYLNDKFFVSDSNETAGTIANINIQNYETYLPSPIQLLIGVNANSSGNLSCAFWDYGNSFQKKKGRWSGTGSNHLGSWRNHSQLQVCSFTHLTHLGMLVLERSTEVLTITDTKILNILSGVGCFLSTLGIFGIFITAIRFDSWREKIGSQILIHLSLATLLEIFFLYFSGIKLLSCRIAGMTTQYVMLSKFAWMLIYAFCQYLRFVRVLGPMPSYLVAKSIGFGWGFGLVPVLCVGLINIDVYEDENFCFPTGLPLYLGIFLPILIIAVINTCIFGKIMCEITNNKFESSSSQSRSNKLNFRLAVLLFFVLGLPWLFGLISNLVGIYWLKMVLVYIFSTAVSLQGFVMFVFYIILNRETWELWKRGRGAAFKNFSEKVNTTSTG